MHVRRMQKAMPDHAVAIGKNGQKEVSALLYTGNT